MHVWVGGWKRSHPSSQIGGVPSIVKSCTFEISCLLLSLFCNESVAKVFRSICKAEFVRGNITPQILFPPVCRLSSWLFRGSIPLNKRNWGHRMGESACTSLRLVGFCWSGNRVLGPATHTLEHILLCPALLGCGEYYLRPFVGCLRGLRMNGLALNLEGKANVTEGVLVNCTGHCRKPLVPCLNHGTCTEHYNHYTCNCSVSAFEGPFCNQGESWSPGTGGLKSNPREDERFPPLAFVSATEGLLQILAPTSSLAHGCATISCRHPCTRCSSSPTYTANPFSRCPATTLPGRKWTSVFAPVQLLRSCFTSAPL